MRLIDADAVMTKIEEIAKSKSKHLLIMKIATVRRIVGKQPTYTPWRHEVNGINLEPDDIVIGVDYTNGKDKTCVSMQMTVEKYNEMRRLAQIGAAVVKAFEQLGSPRITGFAPDDLVGLKSVEELLQWAKEREQND